MKTAPHSRKAFLAIVALVLGGLSFLAFKGERRQATPVPTQPERELVRPPLIEEASELASQAVPSQPEMHRPAQPEDEQPSLQEAPAPLDPEELPPAAPSEEEPPKPLVLDSLLPTLRGMVFGGDLEGSIPIGGAQVVVCLADRPVGDPAYRPYLNGLPIAMTTTDSAGLFRCELAIPEVETLVDIHVKAAGFESQTKQGHWVDIGELENQTDSAALVLAQVEPFRIRPREANEGLALPDAGLELYAVREAGAGGFAPAQPISISDELSLGGDYPAWTNRHRDGIRFIEVSQLGRFAFTAWEPGVPYWIRPTDPGLLLEQPGPFEAGPAPTALGLLRPRPHVSLLLSGAAGDGFELVGEEGPGAWRVQFELTLEGRDQVPPFSINSTAEGLYSFGRKIDLSLAPGSLDSEFQLEDYATFTIEGTAYLDPFSGQRGDAHSEWVYDLRETGPIAPEGIELSLDLSEFRRRPAIEDLHSASVRYQDGSEAHDYWLDWIAADGTRTPAGRAGQLGSFSVFRFVRPRFPCRFELSSSFAEQTIAWEAGFREGAEAWTGERTLLCPKPGTLIMREIEDPFHPVHLFWREAGGKQHLFWEGQLGSLAEPVVLPTGSWVLVSLETGRGCRVRIRPGRDTEATL